MPARLNAQNGMTLGHTVLRVCRGPPRGGAPNLFPGSLHRQMRYFLISSGHFSLSELMEMTKSIFSLSE